MIRSRNKSSNRYLSKNVAEDFFISSDSIVSAGNGASPDMGKFRPGTSQKCRPPYNRKIPPPSSHGLNQSQAFQDGIIS